MAAAVEEFIGGRLHVINAAAIRAARDFVEAAGGVEREPAGNRQFHRVSPIVLDSPRIGRRAVHEHLSPVFVDDVQPGGGNSAARVRLADGEKAARGVRILDAPWRHKRILLLELLHHVVRACHRLDAELVVESEFVHQPAHVAVPDRGREKQVHIFTPLRRPAPVGIDLVKVVVGVAHAVFGIEGMDLAQFESHIQRMRQQVQFRVHPAVMTGSEPGVQPLVGRFGLRGPIYPLIIQQELAISIKGCGERAGAGHPRVEIAVGPRRDGGVDIRIRHLHAELLLDPLCVVFVEFHRFRRLERVIPRPGAAPLPIGHALRVIGIPVRVHRAEIGVVAVYALQPAHAVLRSDVPFQHRVAAFLRSGV
ncbi:MAG: hypothetical protein IANPNBLG_01694 [Bryobacteraceae bacterium]|nr:hypothetical protein [Bryobacteraceae bacterium]